MMKITHGALDLADPTLNAVLAGHIRHAVACDWSGLTRLAVPDSLARHNADA
jgi:hypothetical protein